MNTENPDAAVNQLQDLFHKYPPDIEDLFGKEQYFYHSFYNTPVFMLFFAQVWRLRLDLNAHIKLDNRKLPAFAGYLSGFDCEPGIAALWLILGAKLELCQQYAKDSYQFSKNYLNNLAVAEKIWPYCKPIQQLLVSVDSRLNNLTALNQLERLELFNDTVLLLGNLQKLKQRPDLVIKGSSPLKCRDYEIVKKAVEKFYDDLIESFASKLFIVCPYASFTKDYPALRPWLIMAMQAKATEDKEEAHRLFVGLRNSLESLSKNERCSAAADLAALDQIILSLKPSVVLKLQNKVLAHTSIFAADTESMSTSTDSSHSSTSSSPGNTPPRQSILTRRQPHYLWPESDGEDAPLLNENRRCFSND